MRLYGWVAMGVMVCSAAGCDQVFGTDRPRSEVEVDAAVDAPPDAPATGVRIEVASGAADAMEDPGGTRVNTSWVTLDTDAHWGALRFELDAVHPGAVIVEAYLEVFVEVDLHEDYPHLEITSDSTSNPAPLDMTNSTSISGRTTGAARVTWIDDAVGSGFQKSPSLATIIQERVDDATWGFDGRSVLLILDNLPPATPPAVPPLRFEFRQTDHMASRPPSLLLSFVNP